MKIGCDVDGVLADFNAAYINKCIAVTDKDLFPPRPFDITTWNYPESYGYTAAEVGEVWAAIKADQFFWRSLGPYHTAEADAVALESVTRHGNHDLYFITARPGLTAKSQTERWLTWLFASARRPGLLPTVLITSHKGLAAQTLGLDAYIDDRWENALDVACMHWKQAAPTCRSYLVNRSWNRQFDADSHGIIRVSCISNMLRDLDLLSVPVFVPTAEAAPIR